MADIAGRLIGCRLFQETKVQNALDDVASNNRQALPVGDAPRAPDAEGTPIPTLIVARKVRVQRNAGTPGT